MKKILVAHDEAFNFTYAANVDDLRRLGTVDFFSPLADRSLPECDLLYLPGGYPELFAKSLADNVSMRSAVAEYALAGGRIFAECGGFMYLCRAIDDFPMCAVLPLTATMQGARLHLGYRQMMWNGLLIRGHEFHYSSVGSLPSDAGEVVAHYGQQSARGLSVDTPIFTFKNVCAGYTHWYWAEIGFENIMRL